MKFKNYITEAKGDKSNLKKKVVDFVIDNPNPPDSKFHDLAGEIGVEPDILESIAYEILTDFWANGRYQENGKDMEFDAKELAIGKKIEMEHTSSIVISERIARDHLSEIPDYYTRLKKMEKEAGIND